MLAYLWKFLARKICTYLPYKHSDIMEALSEAADEHRNATAASQNLMERLYMLEDCFNEMAELIGVCVVKTGEDVVIESTDDSITSETRRLIALTKAEEKAVLDTFKLCRRLEQHKAKFSHSQA